MATVPKKILVVDDDEDIRQVTKMVLVNFGYEPECVKNGKEALALLNREKFPIVLMDLRLPEINGIDLCKRIKEKNPETVIYGFYGVVTDDEFHEFEKMGFDGILCKPVSFKVLKRAIEGAFDKIKRATGTDEI
jgi:CheY-like chemotaxis protein